MRKKSYCLGALALLAVCAVASAGIGKTWSYFTTYTEAAGGYTVNLGDKTEITEDFSNWTKRVQIANEEGSEPVYIRVKAFCGEQYTIDYLGDDWTPGEDDWYYYKNPVAGGKSTGTLYIRINRINPEDEDSFNVVVVYESTYVKYDENGNPYAKWDEILDSGSTVSTGGTENTEGDDDTEGGGEG